jgi:hypothetical protein
MRTLLLAAALVAIAGAAEAQQRYGYGSPYGGGYGTHTYGGTGSYGTGSAIAI